jgi:hypothetical protein
VAHREAGARPCGSRNEASYGSVARGAYGVLNELLNLDVRELDHLPPLLGFIRDELSIIGG